MTNKCSYVALKCGSVDSVVVGILRHARKFGEVVVGVIVDSGDVSDAEMASRRDYRDFLSEVIGVTAVVIHSPCECASYLRGVRPWCVFDASGLSVSTRQEMLNVVREWGGHLVDASGLCGVPDEKASSVCVRSERPINRVAHLRALLPSHNVVRILEAHNGISGLVVDAARSKRGDVYVEFDGVWLSSLTNAVAMARPDTGYVDITTRIGLVGEVMEATNKPLVFDADSGGWAEHFALTVRTLERVGVSAVVIEDKIGRKRNSLSNAGHTLSEPSEFAEKIEAGKCAQRASDFMVVARIESLIAGTGVEDALMRARCYVSAGADALMIHSRERHPLDLISVCRRIRDAGLNVPIVCAPTTFGHLTESDLRDAGVDVVIYANHLLRSAYRAMLRAAETILESGRVLEVEGQCISIESLLALIPGDPNA